MVFSLPSERDPPTQVWQKTILFPIFFTPFLTYQNLLDAEASLAPTKGSLTNTKMDEFSQKFHFRSRKLYCHFPLILRIYLIAKLYQNAQTSTCPKKSAILFSEKFDPPPPRSFSENNIADFWGDIDICAFWYNFAIKDDETESCLFIVLCLLHKHHQSLALLWHSPDKQFLVSLVMFHMWVCIVSSWGALINSLGICQTCYTSAFSKNIEIYQ